MKLRQLGEERLLQGLLPMLSRQAQRGKVVLGAGDDCAILAVEEKQLLLLKTDCVVEGVHFTREAKPSAVGWKAMARPLSDFAAMAGVPQFALVTLILPAATTAAWTKALYVGLTKAADAFDVAIVGGETSRIDGPAAISISLAGRVEKDRWISRDGGKAGDLIFVTGRLGGSLRGRHLNFIPRVHEARWLTAHFQVNAMMDLSDGLGADLPRLARASQVGFEIDEAAIPRTRGCTVAQAISDGEDYELLFALRPREKTALERKWKRRFPKLPLTCIGRLTTEAKPQNPKWRAGYDHFQ